MTNQITPVELTPPATQLQEAEQGLTAIAAAFFDAAEAQAIAIIGKYSGVVWQHLETVKGMDGATKARAELRTFRTGIVDKGHAAIKAPLLAVGRLADARKAEISDRLKAAEGEIDALIKAEDARKAAEKAEKERLERERVGAIRENIRGISMMPSTLVGKTSAQMREILGEMTNPADCPEQFAELIEEASAAFVTASEAIGRLIADAEAREAEQARLKAERERLAEEARIAAEQRRREQEEAAAERQRLQEEADKAKAELEAQAAELRRQREEWELEQERARIAEQAARMAARAVEVSAAALEVPAEMDSDVADLITSRPADVQAIRAPQRPTDEQLVMVIADTYQVSEDVAYSWLATFGSKSGAA